MAVLTDDMFDPKNLALAAFDMERLKPEVIRTEDGFTTEAAAKTIFDEMIKRSSAFDLLPEISGTFIHPRPESGDAGCRIDRLLLPKTLAYQHGWRGGCIGIEAKTSGKKLGPLITQAMDYSRCYFTIPDWHERAGELVIPRWIFIYPSKNPHGDLESVMVNNRVGHASYNRYGGELTFGCSGVNVIVIRGDGRIEIKMPKTGNKRGSR